MNTLFIDSGIGGLSTLCEVIKQIPNLNFIYYADDKYSPYGNLNTITITNRLKTIIDSQIHNNIGLIVLACNTATANSINILRKLYNIPIIGTEPAVKPACSKNNNVLVLTTPSTAKQDRFKSLIKKYSVCPITVLPMKNLAKLIENSLLNSTRYNTWKLNSTLKYIIKKAKNKTHIVLGCTHYVFIKHNLSISTCKCVLDGNYGVCKQVLKHIDPNFCNTTPIQKFVFSSKNIDLCKKYRKIFEQTLANV